MNLFARLKRISAGNKTSVTLPVTVPDAPKDNSASDSQEIYKVVAEDKLSTSSTSSREGLSADMVKEENYVPDGADEEMLGTANGEEKLAERRDEVKFIKGDQHNGDAKIDMGELNGGKPAFTGMSKEELMKYANDPFWVRLRWIFFVGFWAIWVAMLVGAILIIIGAPKCAAPQPLPWYKRGLHAKFGNLDAATPQDVKSAEKIYAAGAIYELPAEQTYEVKTADVESRIKQLVDLYQASDIKVILDITPNYVHRDSHLFQEAVANEEKRSAFVWQKISTDLPNNWKKIGGNTTAWEDVEGSYLLSQFQPLHYDLKMNSTLVRQEFSGVLQHLVGLGVQGFRLKNTKFYLINDNLADEDISHTTKNQNMIDYGFYMHTQSTFQDGLGDVLYDYLAVVKNASADAFLSVAEDIIRTDPYVLSNSGGALGIDLPMYDEFMKKISASKSDTNLSEKLQTIFLDTGNTSWLQWNFADVYVDTAAEPSALALFMSLLPGVPIVPVDSLEYTNVTAATYDQIKHMRLSASYMHGELKVFEVNNMIAYSRIKSGNPGYFVIFNPTDSPQSGNFTADNKLPGKMTVSYFSENYNNLNGTKVSTSAKVDLNDLKISAHSTLILTYVPVKSE